MKPLKYFISALFIFSMNACAARFLASGAYSRFDKGVSFYEKKERDKFFESIDKENYPSYDEFYDAVDNFLRRHSNIHIDFILEKTLRSGKIEAVGVRWNKSYVDRRGNLTRVGGSATLIFDVSGDKPRLRNIKGDNPFTQ